MQANVIRHGLDFGENEDVFRFYFRRGGDMLAHDGKQVAFLFGCFILFL